VQIIGAERSGIMGVTKFPNGVGVDDDNNITGSTLTLGGTALTTTVAELNAMSGGGLSAAELGILDGATVTTAELNTLDASANTETIIAAGACSITITNSILDSTAGAMAVTLAAPGADMLGRIKVIEMTADGGDVTLALTNVTGGSAATTCTWANVDEALVLVGGTNAWHVIAESGVVLS
jgi:hypothetical protein